MRDSIIWEQVKQFYKDRFGIEPQLVEIMSDFNILRMCASGTSNDSIAKMFNLDIEYVSYVIEKYFGFKGFPMDLSISPLAIYKEFDSKDPQSFHAKLVSLGFNDNFQETEFMRETAETVYKLEVILDEQWI